MAGKDTQDKGQAWCAGTGDVATGDAATHIDA